MIWKFCFSNENMGDNTLPSSSLIIVSISIFKFCFMRMATPVDFGIYPECQKDFPSHSFSQFLIFSFIECVSCKSAISILLFWIFSNKLFLFFSFERPFIFKEKTDSRVVLSVMFSFVFVSVIVIWLRWCLFMFSEFHAFFYLVNISKYLY